MKQWYGQESAPPRGRSLFKFFFTHLSIYVFFFFFKYNVHNFWIFIYKCVVS